MLNRQISSFSGQYRFLSNFWPCSINIDGMVFTSAEHAYQWRKTRIPEEQFAILNSKTASEAKKIGSKVTLVADWDKIKVTVMREIVMQKFSQDGNLQDALLDTGLAILIEGNYWGDTYWGVCKGKGLNWLGKILMEVRLHFKLKGINKKAAACKRWIKKRKQIDKRKD